MVKQSHIEALGFSTIEEYFEYIIDSRTNGQHKQAKELFQALSIDQRNAFFQYLETAYHYEALDADSNSVDAVTDYKHYFIIK